MNEQQYAIAVDLGGQSFRLAIIGADGSLQLKRQLPVDAARPAGEVAAAVIEQINALAAEAEDSGRRVVAAGVVMPGYMNRERTRLLVAANLPTLGGSDFLERIRAGVHLPIVFDADCNAAAVGEHRFGSGRGVERLIVVTVGTGIGGGVILDGQVLRIFNHIGGSLGHVVVDATGPQCACGARGCVEVRASGRALERLAQTRADQHPDSLLARLRRERQRLTGLEIGEALAQKDAIAQAVVEETGWWLGAGICAWSAIYAPAKVVIGGGIIGLGEPYLHAVRRGVKDVGQPFLTRSLIVEAAALGPDAGLIGAGTLALNPT